MTAADRLALVADVGGTNARFALVDLDARECTLQQAQTLHNGDFASLQHAIETYLADVGQRPKQAAVAVACPVDADEIRLTNRAWSFSRREMQKALGLDALYMLNDFGAVAWAVPALQPQDVVQLFGPEQIASGPVSVLGPGTGLGVALLVGDAEKGWNVVATEGGHVSFAPVGDEERMIEQWMTARHGRTSTERVLCGKGISEIDAVLRGVPAILSNVGPGEAGLLALREPADVVAAALDGHDLAARQTLARFCAVLGSVAGDCALIQGARSVVIAGGIVPRFVPFLRSSAFRERFLMKGRFAAYLERVGVRVIIHPNPGLLGAAMAIRQLQSNTAENTP
ncbi:glucokinase [Solilutibacter silvestris]|uniref:Glucokinase n=1 Tax=Solilutibacter silvestris TaxID=1645665 RepID=A0A2K1PZD3_9GAMM|nr:glucokinase [Lysobacter silvestris]PNS08037.1 glk: glucokinase [Lysobacter silvestris]